ncbi:MAG: thiol-disulfide isomerase-like thioredoxin [Pedosphaera sp.]|nr:thiol-disulfide isomerase-like thioredoxin [Pedosphaera sp.]
MTKLSVLSLIVLMPIITVRAVENETAKEQLPHYKLEVGQELVYEGSSHFQYDGGSFETKEQTTYWVTRQNNDGSWHVVGHNENAFQSLHKGEKEGSSEHKREAFGGFDLFPDGHLANVPESLDDQLVTAIFFKFPDDIALARAGWEDEKDAGDKSLYRLAPRSDPASGKWIFEKTAKGVFNAVYLSTSKSLIYFDPKRGLITKIESENSQGYGFKGTGTGRIELKSVNKKSGEWTAQFAQEADAFLQAKAATHKAKDSIREGAKPEETIAAAEKMLRDNRQKIKLPMIEAQFETELTQLQESGKYLIKQKKTEDELLNKAAADWQTTDIEGKKHALADYRGKVVVLDFWYRGCGWCIRAMPQIKEVSDHFRDKPVAVLGMNTDPAEKDARFVADKLKLNYPTLKAEGLPEKYKVSGFPTLVIIDQKGIVRARHVGYSPKLREEVIKTIDGLLASEAGK